MSLAENGRYPDIGGPIVAQGWSAQRLLPPSRLYGANGIRLGPDGRIYIAQVSGSQISALDLESGKIDVISPVGDDIVAPDDIDFDPSGRLYTTEYMDGRVSCVLPDGTSRVLRDDVPGANGITFHLGRLFIDECRLQGRLLELDLNGGAPRVLLEDLPMPNALDTGPDGLLYFPVIGTGEIWRIHPDGGAAECIAGDLAHPVAVKFDRRGRLVCPQARSGEIARIDVQSGARSILAKLDPCLDNLTFAGDRLFVSHMNDGTITEILGDGTCRTILPGRLQRPLDLAVDEGGRIYIADNVSFYRLVPGEAPECLGRMFVPGYPGGIRGISTGTRGRFAVTTTCGKVAIYDSIENTFQVIATELDQPHGIAWADDEAMAVCEFGTGRILLVSESAQSTLAENLAQPIDIIKAPDGELLVSEAGGGRIAKLGGGSAETFVDNLSRPHGIGFKDETLLVVEAGTKELTAIALPDGKRQTVASKLPVGAPPGVTAKPLKGSPPFVGPIGPFSGLAVAPDGTVYVSGDGEGTVLSFRSTVQ